MPEQTETLRDKDIETATEIIAASKDTLWSGEALTGMSSSEITHARGTSLIVIAGAVSSGKTTLLASIYECFLDGAFADYLFAGSKTLLGFEQRCHEARLASNRFQMTTERTKYVPEYNLLHLCVRDKLLKLPAQDLLFTDLSGELFKDIRNSADECKNHNVFKRADHFVLLLDGARLIDKLERDASVQDANLILKRFLECGTLTQYSLVELLITKADLVHRSIKEHAQHTAYIKNVINKFEQQFKGKFHKLYLAQVAARPDPAVSHEFQRSYGLADVFKMWVQESPSSRLQLPEHNSISIKREIDRFCIVDG